MKKKITVISCAIFVAAMMMFAQPAMSGKWADTPSGFDVQILFVQQVDLEGIADFEFGLVIGGFNFDNGDVPIVKLAGIPCEVEGIFPFEDLLQEKTLWGIIVGCNLAQLPTLPDFLPDLDGPPVFNPLVTLQTGPSVHQFDTFNTTLTFFP